MFYKLKSISSEKKSDFKIKILQYFSCFFTFLLFYFFIDFIPLKTSKNIFFLITTLVFIAKNMIKNVTKMI